MFIVFESKIGFHSVKMSSVEAVRYLHNDTVIRFAFSNGEIVEYEYSDAFAAASEWLNIEKQMKGMV